MEKFASAGGSSQRKLKRSDYCKDYKVTVQGQEVAIRKFEEKLRADAELQDGCLYIVRHSIGVSLHTQSSLPRENHHPSVQREPNPTAHDRDQSNGVPPPAAVMNLLASLRAEPDSEEDTSADEKVMPRGYLDGQGRARR